MELWGGIECTVNRVHEQYFSQLERSGHQTRIEDLDAVAALGVRALRYPILWERTAPDGLASADWSWPDARLDRLRALGVTPIAGLVHHGSGPRHTSLVSADFASGLAEYAGAVARRYPWLESYTPVNEPLTTARFSALYGVWYPHLRDERSFKDALLNQCRATVLAMREIRRVNARAKLVQTDDLGKTYSTPLLAYHAEFSNQRRWLTWDLLCGRVTREHPLWEYLTGACGASPAELLWFADNPCAPDVIGVNYYITSERYLDEEEDKYPAAYRGGNARHRFADVETARCLAHPTGGLKALLAEAWARYGLPLAVTEAHIDAPRDDQIRWLARLWRGAMDARGEGADVRAFTVWALFGSFDWNCLVQESRGYYEPGAFDVRGPRPRPTAVARLMYELANGELPRHPVLSSPGWWVRREDRHVCPPVTALFGSHAPEPAASDNHAPILIAGGSGMLGGAFARICAERGLNCRLLTRSELDIADPESIAQAIDRHQPWALVNAAGYVRVDEAEHDVERCFRENTLGPEVLARACARNSVRLMTFSTDLVFDGSSREPYVEGDAVAPLNVYGMSKAEAEQRVLARNGKALVVRTGAFFGPWDERNYITTVLRALHEGRPFYAASDIVVSPTYAPDLVNACLDLLIDEEAGIWHLANAGALSWADLARKAAQLAGEDPDGLRPMPGAQLGHKARRPAFSALGSMRCPILPPLDDALVRYVQHPQRPQLRR